MILFKKNTLLFLLAYLLIISCSKNADIGQTQNNSNLKNKYLLSQIEAGTLIKKFSYEGNRCIKAERYLSNKLQEIAIFSYDVNGRCTKLVNYDSQNQYNGFQWEFEYNSNNQLVKAIQTEKSQKSTSILEYSADGLLKKVTLTKSNQTFIEYTTYDWKTDGNLLRFSQYSQNGILGLSGEYKYDTKVNLLKIQSIPILIQDEYVWSENNAIESQVTERGNAVVISTLDNTYDAEGKLIQSDLKSNGKILESIKYSYVIQK